MPEISWLARFKAAAAEHPAFAFSETRPIEPLAPITRPEEKANGTDGTNGKDATNAAVPPLGGSDEQKDSLPSNAEPSAIRAFCADREAIDRSETRANGINGTNVTEAENGLLRKAVQVADKLGAKFRIIGADIEIEGDLPDELRAALPADQLYTYFGAARDDQAAIEFLAKLKVIPVLVTDIAAADAVMRELDNNNIIGLDFETGPPGARPEPVQINRTGAIAINQPKLSSAGLDPYASVIQTGQLYPGGDRAYVFHGEELQHLLKSDWFGRQHYVAHNGGFEYKFARHLGIELQLECTVQAVGLLYGTEDHSRSLAAAAKTVLGLEPPKVLQTSCWSAPRLSDGQISYAAADAILTYRLRQKLQLELCRKRLWGYELQRDAIPAVADMELRGMGFDRERHAQLAAEWRSEIADLEAKIVELTGKPAPTKRDEVQEWVRSVGGDLLPTWRRTKTGLLSTTAADLARLGGAPAAKPILELRAKKTLLSNFGDKIAGLVNPVTRRIHANYSISGAKTGRFSCSGPNLQNQPGRNKAPAYKSSFTAAPGYVLIAGDWRQVELRAMAYVSGCPSMTAVFEAGGDLHLETALAMVGRRREDIFPEELAVLRSRAKAVNFSVIYGSTGKGLAETAWKNYGIKMTAEEGDKAIAQFFTKYPRVKEWMNESFVESNRLGYIRIGVGRVVEARWEERHELTPQQCANLPIQGVCADLMLRALKLTFERLRDAMIDGGLVGSIHDELLIEVVEADVGKARLILEETMTEAFKQTFPSAPTTGGVVEIKWGPSWGELQTPEE